MGLKESIEKQPQKSLANGESDPRKSSDFVHLDRATFHVFEYRGRKLLYDVTSTAVFEVNNPLAFNVLRELEDDGSGLDHVRSQRRNKFNSKVLTEITQMKEAGLFVPDILEPKESVENYLESLFNHHSNKLLLMVSQTCNYRCVYCYAVENNFPDEGGLMDEETALQAIDHLFKVSGRRKHLTVSFFGGEPLINFSLIRKVVDYSLARANKEGREVEFLMSSNGSLITEKIADYLVKHEFSMLVSLDGPPETHNRFRPTKKGGPSHHLSLRGALRLLEQYPRKSFVKVKAVMNHENHDQLEIVEYLEKLGFTNIGLGGSRERPWGCQEFDLHGSDFADLFEGAEKLLDRFLYRLDRGRPLGYNPFYHSVINIGRKRRMLGITCGVGRNCNAVSLDGNIYPCHRYVGMEAHSIGDIQEGLDHDKTMKYYRALHNNAERSCRPCWARNICGGDCPWYLSKEDGSIWPPLAKGCKDVRKSMERAIWLHFELQKRHPDYLRRIKGN